MICSEIWVVSQVAVPKSRISTRLRLKFQAQHYERATPDGTPIALPSHVAGSGTLDRLIDTAHDYAKASTAENTNKAYAADWKHFARWCRLKGTEPLPPSAEMIGLYLAAPTGPTPAFSVSTIERRLAGLVWNYAQRGVLLDRKDRYMLKPRLIAQ